MFVFIKLFFILIVDQEPGHNRILYAEGNVRKEVLKEKGRLRKRFLRIFRIYNCSRPALEHSNSSEVPNNLK